MYIKKKTKSTVSNKIFGTSRKDPYYVSFLVILSVNNQPLLILGSLVDTTIVIKPTRRFISKNYRTISYP